MKLFFTCSSTKVKFSDTLLYHSYNRVVEQNPSHEFYMNFVSENKRSLTSVYNDAINKSEGYDYFIILHDDISIDDNDFVNKINKYIGEDSIYDICGVAGNKTCQIKDKNLWHIMSAGHTNTLSGAVAHYTHNKDETCFFNNF